VCQDLPDRARIGELLQPWESPFFLVALQPGAEQAAVEDRIGRALLRRHRLADAADRDFAIYNQGEMLAQLQQMGATFTALLGAVAAIALLVGGIGIMNIMLVAVTERTREIGVRMALGARQRDIRRQFLIEAVAVCLVGGACGLTLGAGLALGLGSILPFKPLLGVDAAAVALGVSGAVGVFFGWWPARQASRLDPVEALRHE